MTFAVYCLVGVNPWLKGWLTGFEPATAWTTIRPLLAAAPTNPA